ncbi:hypothetical protein JM654_21960 [Microbacterium oxydans]|nr:hypothetical protein [Microbacterium oxydans]
MSSLRLILTSSAAAVATLSVQVLGLITLAPTDFGLFSIVYLAGAFALSLALSLICEAATRSRQDVPTSWPDFSGASTEFALIFAAVSALVVSLTNSPLTPYWWLIALAIGGSAYRSTARFYAVENGDTRGSVLGDAIAAIVAVVLSVVTLALHSGELSWVLGTWAASSVVAAVFSRWPALGRPGVLVRWTRQRWTAIAPLVRDSLIMDASSIGTPYALAPILGVGPFGVYRAVSNVAAPVRLLLNPIRPRIARLRMSAATVGAVVAGGIVLGGLAAGGAAAARRDVLAARHSPGPHSVRRTDRDLRHGEHGGAHLLHRVPAAGLTTRPARGAARPDRAGRRRAAGGCSAGRAERERYGHTPSPPWCRRSSGCSSPAARISCRSPPDARPTPTPRSCSDPGLCGDLRLPAQHVASRSPRRSR